MSIVFNFSQFTDHKWNRFVDCNLLEWEESSGSSFNTVNILEVIIHIFFGSQFEIALERDEGDHDHLFLEKFVSHGVLVEELVFEGGYGVPDLDRDMLVIVVDAVD